MLKNGIAVAGVPTTAMLINPAFGIWLLALALGVGEGAVELGVVGVGAMSVAAGPTVSVGGTMGAGRATEPPVNRNTVPRTMLRATAAFKPKEAYQRQSRFWALTLDLLGIYSSKFRAPLYHKPESGQMFALPVALPRPFGLCGSLGADETRRVSIPRQKLTLPYTLALWECQALTPPHYYHNT